MADAKITALGANTTPLTTDILPMVDDPGGTPATQKITIAKLVYDNPYKFSVYRNSAADTGNAAFAKITFDTELFDTNNNFATGTYTAPVAGFYQFNARFSVAEAHTRTLIGLYKNGAELVRGGDIEIGSVSNGSVSLSTTEQSAANDTWDIYAYGSAALTLEVGNAPRYTYFNGFLVSIT